MGNSCLGHSAVRNGKIKAGDINNSGEPNNGVIHLKEVPATKMDDVNDPPVKRGRRRAVAAESYDPTAEENDTEPIVFHEKTKEQLNCLQDAAKGIIFFKKCDDEQKNVLFGAMFEKRVKEGDVIIRQGDDGDNFYVIEKGEYDVLITNGQKENKVATLRDRGFFGELALLYNCPRNATIISTGEGILWGLDQKTFRQIVVKATAKKRQHFEELLKGVSMLDSLTSYELMNLTDALDVETYRTNEIIIKEGDTAEVMYFIMEGEVCVKVCDKQSQTEKEVSRLGRGKYFGELALVLQKPRVASVYACSDNVKLAVLNINAFERLLGPCVDIMKRNIDAYEKERLKRGLNSLTDELQSAANGIGIDIDDIGNLEDLLKVVFIDKKCGNLKVVIDGGELTRNINQKKMLGVLQAYRSSLSDKCFNKQVEYCESVRIDGKKGHLDDNVVRHCYGILKDA